jgi:hypothetical protein
MAESEPRKRRGRPRVSEEEKKRHTLTFRMRSDLRDAVEELAEVNGRTLSEQVEYYVDSAVFTEAGIIYQYSIDALSPTLYKCIANKLNNKNANSVGHLSINFPSGHPEMLTIAGKNYLNNPETPGFLPWVEGPGGREGAVAMVRAMLAATRDGTIKAMVEAVGSEAVKAALDEEARAVQSGSSQPQQAGTKPDILAHVTEARSRDGT